MQILVHKGIENMLSEIYEELPEGGRITDEEVRRKLLSLVLDSRSPAQHAGPHHESAVQQTSAPQAAASQGSGYPLIAQLISNHEPTFLDGLREAVRMAEAGDYEAIRAMREAMVGPEVMRHHEPQGPGNPVTGTRLGTAGAPRLRVMIRGRSPVRENPRGDLCGGVGNRRPYREQHFSEGGVIMSEHQSRNPEDVRKILSQHPLFHHLDPMLQGTLVDFLAKEDSAPAPATQKASSTPTQMHHPKGSAPIDEKYFEVPVSSSVKLLCSDNQCPCSGDKRLKPGQDGYVFISDRVVEERRDALSWSALQVKVQQQAQRLGANVVFENGVVVPIFLCEVGARRRSLDLEVAAADAENWSRTGLFPLRPTPLMPRSAET